MIQRSRLVAFCALMALLAAITARSAPGVTVPVTLAVPDRANANVSLAADGSYVAATWAVSETGGATDIYAAFSRDGGGSFSPPVRVNSTAADARVNGEQPPRVALIRRVNLPPAIAVVWTAKGDAGTRIQSSLSNDSGRTFSKSSTIPGGEGAGNRGWENVTVDAQGKVRVLWLDHREMAKPASGPAPGDDATHNHAGHDATPEAKRDGAAMAQLSKLYFATVGDAASPRMLLGGVCYCCKTAIATAADGSTYAAWRHVYPGNIRDIAFTVSRDGGRTFAAAIRVSEDKWQIDGCPEDGPAIAIDPRNQIHVVWPTLVNDGPDGRPSIGLFYATSSDGRSFTPRRRIATEGVPHHPQMTLAGGSLVLAWDELKNGTRQAIVARRELVASLEAPFARSVVSGDQPGVYPVVASTSKGALVAWTSTTPARSVIRVAALQ